jgi:hypothetical protein
LEPGEGRHVAKPRRAGKPKSVSDLRLFAAA